MIKSFKELNLPQELHNSLERLEFNNPTPVQAKSIPHALKGEDVIASAQTGTGKTLAFVLPMLARMMTTEEEKSIILMPTRELAMQVAAVIDQLIGRNIKLKTVTLIGGDSMSKQLKQLKESPRIIVGTPGRINDHLNRKSLRLGNATFLTLDETDRMLDMGFGIQIDTIIERMDPKRQTLMFSATMPKGILKLAEKYLNAPNKIEIEVDKSNLERISQEFMHVNEADKLKILLSQLESRQGSVVLFVKTKRKVEKIAKELSNADHKVAFIHGDLNQGKRESVIKRFRASKFRIMVATDVAARGLDVPHIEHVINYDLPQAAEDYVHRIGRTGRAGATGSSLSLVSGDDKGNYLEIQYLLDPTLEKPKVNKGRSRGGNGGGRGGFGGSRASFGGNGGGRGGFKGRSERGERGEGRGRSERSEGRPERGERKSEGFGAKKSFGAKKPSRDGANAGAGRKFSGKSSPRKAPAAR